MSLQESALPTAEAPNKVSPKAKGFLGFLSARAARLGDATALCNAGEDHGLSYKSLFVHSVSVGQRLRTFGIRPGDRIAILSESRPEWAPACFGSWLAGAVVVPLDPRATPQESEVLLRDSGARHLFASQECLARAEELAKPLGASVFPLDAVTDGVAAQPLTAEDAIEMALPDLTPEDVALIVYTSGTTGAAKGVQLTAGCLLFQADRLAKALDVNETDVVLSMLPLHHLLEFTCGFITVLRAGGRIVYCRSLFPADIAAAFRRHQATWMITVPLFLRLLGREIRFQAGSRKLRRSAFAAFHGLAPLLPGPLRRALFRPVHASLGGSLRGFICGGAPLDPVTEEFFDRMGLVLYQGYGLTETGPVISVNALRERRMGSVGRPLPGVDVRIAPTPEAASDGSGEGEIWTRGPHVMAGYFGREEATAQVIDRDRWLHTGDLGYLDPSGYLHVTGRIKSLIVLEGGKKVHPEEVEQALASTEAVKEACVLGMRKREGGEEVVAVVKADAAWAARQPPDEIAAKLAAEVDRAVAALSPYKRPGRLVISEDELPKTASRKIRRDAVREWLRARS
jgi:long-chain acyl-CoA synthetase